MTRRTRILLAVALLVAAATMVEISEDNRALERAATGWAR